MVGWLTLSTSTNSFGRLPSAHHQLNAQRITAWVERGL
jgi:hypothetical protein